MFSASCGSDNSAIDDIKFLESFCNTPGSCDFENGKCFYTNSKLTDFDWIVGSGRSSPGPVTDHTTGGVYGLFTHLLKNGSKFIGYH